MVKNFSRDHSFRLNNEASETLIDDVSRLQFVATFFFLQTGAQKETVLRQREGRGLVAQLSSILAPSHLVIKSETDQPQDVSQTNLTAIANEVFLSKERFDVVGNMFICRLPET